MPKYLSPEEFSSEAERVFGFLEPTFVGLEKTNFRHYYSTGSIGLAIMFNDGDGRVITVVEAQVGERNVNASVDCLYVSARLGPAQDIREIVRSPKQLRPVLDSQAAAIKKLLPVLDGPSGPDLLVSCHGR